ncbi:hypothetical protein V8E51_000267 [Hyaloscypha variabilis]
MVLNDPNYGVGFEDGYERDEQEELNDELHEFFYGERPQDLRDLAEFNESYYGTVATASGESSASESNTLVTAQERTRFVEIGQRRRLRSGLPSQIPNPRRSVASHSESIHPLLTLVLNPRELNCSICYEFWTHEHQPSRLPCGHVFGYDPDINDEDEGYTADGEDGDNVEY